MPTRARAAVGLEDVALHSSRIVAAVEQVIEG
ncbi:MAG: hypothetical protein QOG34_1568, partial [Frankiaceae bacterium]|nr:hypothetical protein [Frankiaceae bacterium]